APSHCVPLSLGSHTLPSLCITANLSADWQLWVSKAEKLDLALEVRFAPESGQSNLLRAVQDHGLRRENDKAYAPSRTSIKGSSDSWIPSVSWPGRKSNFFSASALSGTTLSTVKTPSSATLRSSGQATDGSLVESPAAASCAFR